MRKWVVLGALVFFGLLFSVPVQGAAVQQEESPQPQQEEEITQEDIAATKEELLGDLELSEIEKTVEELLAGQNFSFMDTVKGLLSGEEVFSAETFVELVKQFFLGELSAQKQNILQIFLLILVAALLMNFSHVFENGQISDMAFYMVYLLIFGLLLAAFASLSSQLSTMLTGAVSFMKVLAPAYYLSIVASDGVATASGYYQIVLLVIYGVQWLLLKVVIPGVNIYVLLGVVNYLSKEDFLSKLAELLKTVIGWIMKSMIALIVGLQIVQKMISPAIDSLQRSAIGKTASAIPGVGNAIDAVTELVLGCSVLVRNCLGAAALIVLVVLAVGPIFQLGATTLLYRALAAVAQPVSDKRMVGCLTVMGEGCALLLRVLVTGEILFLLTVAIVAIGGFR